LPQGALPKANALRVAGRDALLKQAYSFQQAKRLDEAQTCA